MAEVNIGCVPKLSWINLTGRNLSARPFLNYFRAGLQTVFNGTASLSGVLKTVLLNDSEIQTATVKRIAAGERKLPAQIEHITSVHTFTFTFKTNPNPILNPNCNPTASALHD